MKRIFALILAALLLLSASAFAETIIVGMEGTYAPYAGAGSISKRIRNMYLNTWRKHFRHMLMQRRSSVKGAGTV